MLVETTKILAKVSQMLIETTKILVKTTTTLVTSTKMLLKTIELSSCDALRPQTTLKNLHELLQQIAESTYMMLSVTPCSTAVRAQHMEWETKAFF